jgi:hypothetical protein
MCLYLTQCTLPYDALHFVCSLVHLLTKVINYHGFLLSHIMLSLFAYKT